jgi:hypothetical protein
MPPLAESGNSKRGGGPADQLEDQSHLGAFLSCIVFVGETTLGNYRLSVKYPSMVSQACSAASNVLKGDPVTLTAPLLP